MLSEMKINDYIDLLASDAPAPGGGNASALCGAQGAGLCAMVAALTLGKKKYEEHQELCRDVYEQARTLSERMCALIDEDTEAFNRVSAAFKLPKDTDEDKAVRKAAIAEATLGATMVPLDTLHRAHDGLELAKMLIGKSNTNCASDIGVAALNLVSCARGAWLRSRGDSCKSTKSADLVRYRLFPPTPQVFYRSSPYNFRRPNTLHRLKTAKVYS